LLLVQLGDRNQFLIFALGALSGAALWGVAGGMVGLLLAMLPVLALGPAVPTGQGVRYTRWAAAGLLILWATLHLRRAFGV
jgi:putative Ca2+/H+ antiporter (TMEM165/GDT1 family)